VKLLGLRVALYLRRSKEEHQAASIEVQRGEGTAYIAREGGTLDPTHIFIDDNHGRAEFKKRPGLISMLNAAKRGGFDAVVVRDETRLGGDTNRTSLFISDLLDAGRRLFYYFSDEEVTIDGAVDKFMINVRNFAAELEREKISQRTHEHLQTKARRGLNVGGRVFGYDNVEIKDGERRVRVEYRINPEQAEIVREIFRRYAAGEGVKTIVRDLNARGILAPRAGSRGTGSWSPGSVQPMLRRERYRGVIIWGVHEKMYKGGTKVRVKRPANELTRVEVPELRIIDDDLWQAVQARLGQKTNFGRSRPSGARPKYLLSGFSRCGHCGGPMQVINGKASYEPIKVYTCAYHRERGTCDCSTRRPVQAVDKAVLGWIEEHLLTEQIIARVFEEIRRRLSDRPTSQAREIEDLRKQAGKLRGEITRLGEAIVSTTEPPHALVKMMGEREKSLAVLEARIATLQVAPSVLDLEVRRLEKEARGRIADLQGMASRKPEEARKLLAALLVGPVTFISITTPEGPRFEVRGQATLAGAVSMSSVPNGVLHVRTP
jgi:site-specific DNA recombinase